MKVSIRKHRYSKDCISLRVYRPHTRSQPISGSATQTKSGYWIVQLPRDYADVVTTESEARDRLNTYYAARESAY